MSADKTRIISTSITIFVLGLFFLSALVWAVKEDKKETTSVRAESCHVPLPSISRHKDQVYTELKDLIAKSKSVEICIIVNGAVYNCNPITCN